MLKEESKSSGSKENKVPEERPSVSGPASGDPIPDTSRSASLAGPVRSIGRRSKRRRWALKAGAGIAAFGVALYFAIPGMMRAFNTVSTDYAYVNGDVTFVAARVPGQITKVTVDDNYRVHKGGRWTPLFGQPDGRDKL